MSTDEIDELAKSVAGKGGKWHFDKEHRLLFIDKVVGGAIPREFIQPIENGVREAMETGVLAGYEMVDLRRGTNRWQLPRCGQFGNGVQNCRVDGF